MSSRQKIPLQKIIGLTGPMAAGKNAAADILAKEGFAVIDADKASHQALEQVKERVLERFKNQAATKGIELLAPDGSIIRRNLAKIVFASAEDLQALENILYPEVTQLIQEFIQKNADKNTIINAIALHKTTLIDRCDFLIYVDANPIIRFFRALKRDKLPPLHIIKRFLAQKQLYAQYLQRNVDIYTVGNNKTPADLKRNLQKISELFPVKG